MQYSLIFLALVGAVTATPQGVPNAIAPKSPPPAGCSSSYSGSFQITAVKVQAKRDLAPRSGGDADGALTLTLANGILTDSKSRIGSIVANYQFQFDGPPAQAGAIYTAGFSACSNGSLAIGGSAVFYQCLSGDFYNLYDRSWAAQCSPVEIMILPSSGSGAVTPGKPQGTAVAQIADGQIQAGVAVPISETNGVPQVPTASLPKITQIGDGQIQVPTGGVSPPKNTNSNAKPPSGPAITQIGDGQIQAPTGPAAPPKATQPSVQVPSVPGVPITQIGDGQIQVGTATPVTPTPATYSGSAAIFSIGADVAALIAGVAAIGLL